MNLTELRNYVDEIESTPLDALMASGRQQMPEHSIALSDPEQPPRCSHLNYVLHIVHMI